MDGTGKSHLVRELANVLNIPVHPRAATSKGGPVQNLWDWAVHDVDTWHQQPFSVYDRHPLISEYVYGPICRKSMDSRFHTVEARALIKRVAFGSVIVFCDPGDGEIGWNVGKSMDNQLDGVVDNWGKLTLTYRNIFTMWQCPLRVINWNYREPGNKDAILALARAQQIAHERAMLNV